MSNAQDVSSFPSDIQKSSNEDAQIRKAAYSLQMLVTDNANPPPAIIAFCTVITLLVCYMIYLQWIKPDISGVWVDSDGEQYVIESNILDKMTSSCVLSNKYKSVKCDLVDNYISLNDSIGTWDYDSNIVFSDGNKFYKI